LQRRHVYKTGVAYAVVTWLLIQIATQVFPFFEVPSWAIRMVVILLVLGFPVALVLAWAYEITPEGIKLADEVEPEQSMRQQTGRVLDFIIIGVLLTVIAVFAWQRFGPTTAPPPPKKSIAVLPFVDLSQNRDQEYFSDGISEQIINSLAKVRGLLVVARTSAFVFKNKFEDVRVVGDRLRVTHVLEGSVSRGPGKVRVDTRLIDVANGFQLWSESYDSAEQDILSLETDIAQKVANALQVELRLSDAQQLAKSRTPDAEGYDFYLRGRYLLNKRTTESLIKARALFEQTVAKDPLFALGHTGVADANILLAEYGAISADEAARVAWPEITKALNLDEHLAEAYISRAMLLTDFEWNWPAAENDFRKAIDLKPGSVAVYHWFAFHMAQRGRFDEAMRMIDQAQKLDPLSPIVCAAKARLLWVGRRPKEAIAQCNKALELESNFVPAFVMLARTHALQEQYPEAIEATKKYIEFSKGSAGQLELAYVYARSGNKAEAEALLAQVTEEKARQSPFDRAAVSAALLDNDGAFRWLEDGITDHNVAASWLQVDPRFDTLRRDRRFDNLLAARIKPRRGP